MRMCVPAGEPALLHVPLENGETLPPQPPPPIAVPPPAAPPEDADVYHSVGDGGDRAQGEAPASKPATNGRRPSHRASAGSFLPCRCLDNAVLLVYMHYLFCGSVAVHRVSPRGQRMLTLLISRSCLSSISCHPCVCVCVCPHSRDVCVSGIRCGSDVGVVSDGEKEKIE